MAAATDGEKDSTKGGKAQKTKEPSTVKSKAELASIFEKNGYSTSTIKAATKVSKLTAQVYIDLQAACTRVTLHPEPTDFIGGDWSALRKMFKDSFGHSLPEIEPANRTPLQTLWLECIWKSRDGQSTETEGEQEQNDLTELGMSEEDLEEQHRETLVRQDEELDQQQCLELEALQKKLADDIEKAELRAKKDKQFSDQREKLLKDIATVNKPRHQLGLGAWNNVQGAEAKRTSNSDEADETAAKKRKLEDQQRKEREDDLRAKEAGILGKPSNHDSLARMIKGLDTWGLLSMVSGFKVAEALQDRCKSKSSGAKGLNEVEDALLQDQGGRAMTVVGEVIRLLIGPFPTKMLEIFRRNPRAFWPLTFFARANLENTGTNEGFMVQLQIANGVTNTKSTFAKLEEKWETINDLIEPLRRLTNLTFTVDIVYGQCLQGLLGMVI